MARPKKAAAADIGQAVGALIKAEIAVIEALRARFPLDKRILVRIEQAGSRDIDAVVTGYTGGPQAVLQVILLGARAWTKKTTREIGIADVVQPEEAP